MTCGCKQKHLSQNVKKSRAAMCASCPEYVERCNDVSGCNTDGFCNLSQSKVYLHINGKECPLYAFPDKDNIVLWCGIHWYGVPFPIRLYLYLFHPKHPKISSFDSCGCIVFFKNLFMKVKNLINKYTYSKKEIFHE